MHFAVKDYSGTITDPYFQHFIACRIKVGDSVRISDFQNSFCECQITSIEKSVRIIKYKILHIKSVDETSHRVLYQAILERQYLEKLVEILPLIKARELRLFYADNSIKQEAKLERLNSILQRSCEQSECLEMPKISILESKEFNNFLIQEKPVVLNQTDKNTTNFHHSISTSVVIGPEGGFSSKEIDHFETLNLEFCNMGSMVYPGWLAGFAYFERINEHENKNS